MKIKTSELTRAALDWAMAKSEGFTECDVYGLGTVRDWGFAVRGNRRWERVLLRPNHDRWYARCDGYPWGRGQIIWEPSVDWKQIGPIIERERIDLKWTGEAWIAGKCVQWVTGPTPQIAACRCYVASKMGDEVDVPEELI